MYTMPKNLLSICVNFALATQRWTQNAFSVPYHKANVKFVESPAHAKYFVGIFEQDRGENPDSILIVTTNRREFYADKS